MYLPAMLIFFGAFVAISAVLCFIRPIAHSDIV